MFKVVHGGQLVDNPDDSQPTQIVTSPAKNTQAKLEGDMV